MHRLEYAPVYFDFRTFPNRETKIALQRVQERRFPQVQQNSGQRSGKIRILGIDVYEVDWGILCRKG